ncbi:MAG: trypsin-like serine protease [Planctomycetota bacterium]
MPRICRHTHPALAAGLTAAMLAALPAELGFAGTVLEPSMQSFHIQRGKSGNGRAVGQVQVYDDTGTAIAGFGSASLITTAEGDGLWMLTAAHVIDGASFFQIGFGDFIDNTDPEFLFSPSTFGNVVQPVAWYLPDTYNGNVVSAEDIALVRLEANPGVDLKRLGLRSDNSDLVGSVVDIYGYGSTGTGATGQQELDGRKRAGRNVVESIDGPDDAIAIIDFDVATIDPLNNGGWEARYLLQNYTPEELAANPFLDPRPDRNDKRIPFEYMIAQGDSGGPWVTSDDIVAVNSFGRIPFGFLDDAGAVLVEPWIPWIEAVVADVENGGNTSTVIVDGVAVVAGSQGFAVGPSATEEADPGTGGTGIANSQYYSELLRQYYEEGESSLLLQEKAELVGAVNRGESVFANLSTAAQRLGLASDATVTEVLTEIDDTLQADFGEELERFVRTPNPNLTVEDVQALAIALGNGDITVAEFEDAAYVWADNTDPNGLFLGLAAPSSVPIDPNDPPLPDELPIGALPVYEEGTVFIHGDANGDGVVDLLDFDILAFNFGDDFAAYDTGDFTGDFNVDLLDFDILAFNFGQTASAPIPEPASLAVLAALAGLGVARRRRA